MAGSHLHLRMAVFVACVLLLSGTVQRGLALTNSRDVAALNGLLTKWTASPALNWGTGDPCETPWIGLVCDGSNTTVTQLTLNYKNLNGQISSSIGGLTGLTILDLSNNPQLSGPLPAEIGLLSNLQTLSIQQCSLTGPLPTQLGNLAQLVFLGLNNNTINGNIPASLGRTNLTWLDVSSNQLSGPIPVADANNPVGLNNLTNIQHFHLNNNSFTGSISAEFFSLRNIVHLLVNFNELNGSLPTVSNLSPTLQVIRVDGNNMGDLVPAGYDAFPSLTELHLKGNKFTGQLPNLGNATTLNLLDLGYNNFNAEPVFPNWVLSLTRLNTLNLAHLSIGGSIPPSIFNLPVIQGIDLSFNQFSGPIAFENTTSPTLTIISLQGNQINGFSGYPTPSGTNVSIGLQQNPICQNIYFILPSECAGESESGIWSHPTVNSGCSGQSFDCGNGRLLNWYTCSCSYPLELDLLLTVPSLSNLDMAASELEIDLAAAFGLFQNQTFARNMNYLPNTNIEALVWVFPNSGDYLPNSVSQNITSSLRHHDIGIREGAYLLKNFFTAGSFSGGKSLSIGAIIGIVVGSVFGVLIIAGSLAYAVYHKMRADRAVMNNPFASWGGGSAEFGEAPKLKGARWFSLAELKVYTDNWSDDNMIGVGGYGKVYRGELPNGDLVAIKRATEGSMQGANEFKNEIELLSRVHHRNLVGLVGFCYEGGEQALIYEFMSNGTLTDHLKGRGDQPLSWQSRLEIALASAIGINYLHDHASPPIIHRDIKSANILLNEKMVAKVADFGLSKLAPDEGEKLVYSVNVKGTLGYLDPEYYMTQNLTDKSDVYSFGVVLLELLTARPPIDQGRFVVREFRNALDRGGIDALRPLLDPAMQDIPSADLEPYLKIALSCVEEDGASRPTTAEIVKQLQGLDVFSKAKVGLRAMDIEPGVKKVKFADDFENDQEELLSSDFPQASPEALYSTDSFRYSGAYGASMTVKPK